MRLITAIALVLVAGVSTQRGYAQDVATAYLTDAAGNSIDSLTLTEGDDIYLSIDYTAAANYDPTDPSQSVTVSFEIYDVDGNYVGDLNFYIPSGTATTDGLGNTSVTVPITDDNGDTVGLCAAISTAGGGWNTNLSIGDVGSLPMPSGGPLPSSGELRIGVSSLATVTPTMSILTMPFPYQGMF